MVWVWYAPVWAFCVHPGFCFVGKPILESLLLLSGALVTQKAPYALGVLAYSKPRVLSEEGAQEYLRLVPHARFIDVAGAGHMVAGDRNDVFNDAVVEFLHTLDG